MYKKLAWIMIGIIGFVWFSIGLNFLLSQKNSSQINFIAQNLNSSNPPVGYNPPNWGCSNHCDGNAGYCGNGKAETPEQCDDGNSNNYDSCSNSCSKSFCGDNICQISERDKLGNPICKIDCKSMNADISTKSIEKVTNEKWLKTR